MRIFPRAMLWGMAVAATIYVMVAVLSSMLVPAAELAEAKSSALFRVLEAGAPGFHWRSSARSGCLPSSTPR